MRGLRLLVGRLPGGWWGVWAGEGGAGFGVAAGRRTGAAMLRRVRDCLKRLHQGPQERYKKALRTAKLSRRCFECGALQQWPVLSTVPLWEQAPFLDVTVDFVDLTANSTADSGVDPNIASLLDSGSKRLIDSLAKTVTDK
eukprot:gene5031-5273_t